MHSIKSIEESPQKNMANRRLQSEIIKMRRYCKLKGIQNTQIANKCGITAPNVWRFINGKSKEPSFITFLLIAEAIGWEFEIKRPL